MGLGLLRVPKLATDRAVSRRLRAKGPAARRATASGAQSTCEGEGKGSG